ncbi:MAG: NACHT domain-containing protein [Proteobacteria bacterium]|nr:NACHT domain-containing protein [Pseudomonadota bacterium]MCP4917618.1 NACHT domain-containing protein [Pseudomonadota bacterium]
MTLEEAWRRRLSHHHALWTSPLLMPGAVFEKPLEAIAIKLTVSVSGAGDEELDADLVRGRRSVLVGPAGSGKTTALRLLFRELLADERTLPLLLDLRSLPARVPFEIDGWIEDLLVLSVPEAREHTNAFRSVALGDGPRPVLLLDGWDELGDSAVRVRELLLGLCQSWPRLDVVVASRPVARGLPRVDEGFQHLLVQPLGTEPVAELIRRLVDLTFVPEAQDEARTRFMSMLAADPAAMQLARRPLLLQILLLMGDRSGPVRRDAVYRDCVTTLLFARTLENDPKAALARLGALAWGLQLHGNGAWHRVLAEAFGDESPVERARFVAWIVGTTGLIEPVDGGFRFPHPVLRESLAARHVQETTQPARRPARVRALAADTRHWEVLRLWLAALEAREPGMTYELVEQTEEIPLLVSLVADGLGDEDMARSIGERLRDALREGWPPRIAASATALASSGHPGRVQVIAELLVAEAEELDWPAWLRLREFVHDADLGVELPPPVRPEARMVLDAIGGRVELQGELAVGRMLSAASPLWPGTPWQAALLWIWPSRRPMVSRWLQRLAGMGLTVAELRSAPPPPEVDARDRAFWLERVRDEWTGRLDDHGTYVTAEHWAHVLALTDPRAPAPLDRQAVLEILAETTTPHQAGGVVALMRAAAREALGRGSQLDRLLAMDMPHSMWPALARAVAGRATPPDRELLVSVASEGTDGPLGLGLRYIVRGDVWTVDGVVRLEDLGVELPLLD